MLDEDSYYHIIFQQLENIRNRPEPVPQEFKSGVIVINSSYFPYIMG